MCLHCREHLKHWYWFARIICKFLKAIKFHQLSHFLLTFCWTHCVCWTHCGLSFITSWIQVNIGSGNGLLSHGTKWLMVQCRFARSEVMWHSLKISQDIIPKSIWNLHSACFTDPSKHWWDHIIPNGLPKKCINTWIYSKLIQPHKICLPCMKYDAATFVEEVNVSLESSGYVCKI